MPFGHVFFMWIKDRPRWQKRSHSMSPSSDLSSSRIFGNCRLYSAASIGASSAQARVSLGNTMIPNRCCIVATGSSSQTVARTFEQTHASCSPVAGTKTAFQVQAGTSTSSGPIAAGDPENLGPVTTNTSP